MAVSPIVSSLQTRDQGVASGTESKRTDTAVEFASLVQTATKNFASNMASQAAGQQGQGPKAFEKPPRSEPTVRADQPTRADRQVRERQDADRRARSTEKPVSREVDDSRDAKEPSSRRDVSDVPEDAPVVVNALPVVPEEAAAIPQALAVAQEVTEVKPQTAPANASSASGGAVRSQPTQTPISGQAPAASQQGATLSALSPADLDVPVDLPPPSTAASSTQAQAQAQALARTLEPGSAPLRVSVTEQKAPAAFTATTTGQTAATVAEASLGAEADTPDFGGQGSGSNGQNPAGQSPTGQSAAPQSASPPFFGVAVNAPAFTVPTLNDVAARSQAAGAMPQGAVPTQGTAEDAAVSLKAQLAASPGEGVTGADRVGASGASDFSQILRGTVKGEAATQPYTQREVVHSSPDQVHVHIRKAFGDGVDRITIQLRPAHLGRIDVRVETAQDGTVTVHVQADKVETLDMMARDARSLEQALKDAGLQADRDSLNFSLRGEERQQAEGNQDNDRRSGRGSSHATDGGEESPALASSEATGLNADGSLDIRV